MVVLHLRALNTKRIVTTSGNGPHGTIDEEYDADRGNMSGNGIDQT